MQKYYTEPHLFLHQLEHVNYLLLPIFEVSYNSTNENVAELQPLEQCSSGILLSKGSNSLYIYSADDYKLNKITPVKLPITS